MSGELRVWKTITNAALAGTAVGTEIELRLIAETTALSNASGTILERQENGGLVLEDGTIEVTGSTCTTDTTLCLLDDRFRLEVAWTDFQGATGSGTPVQLTDETGYFWFFGQPRGFEPERRPVNYSG